MQKLRAAVASVLRLLPDALVARILPPSTRYDPALVPAPPVAPDTPVRLYIAPVNWAGQGWQWARAAERNIEGVGAVSMAYRLGNGFGHPVDESVPVGAYLTSRSWQDRERRAVTNGFSHVIVEAVRNPFGRIDEPLRRQVSALEVAGVRVAVACHGSEIRLPSAHAEREPDSPFAPGLWRETGQLERHARANRAVLAELAVPTFVSTPDLLFDVPEASWLPVVVEVDAWRNDSAPLERVVPIVVHAPSRGILKGSDLVDPILGRLHEEGLVEYRRVEGVPSAEMPALFRSADIVLDQFRLGDYGVAACEALAAGRVVIAHVSEHSRNHVRSVTGVDVPIVESRAAGLDAVIRALLEDRDSARRTAARGPEFVGQVHDGRSSAAALQEYLAS